MQGDNESVRSKAVEREVLPKGEVRRREPENRGPASSPNRPLTSLNAQRFEDRVARVGVEARLKLGEELPRYCGNVPDARHR